MEKGFDGGALAGTIVSVIETRESATRDSEYHAAHGATSFLRQLPC